MAKRQADLDRGVERMLALSRDRRTSVAFQVTRGVTRPVWEPESGRHRALRAGPRDRRASSASTSPRSSAGGGSDGNFTGAMGIPTLDGLGVEGAGAAYARTSTSSSTASPAAAGCSPACSPRSSSDGSPPVWPAPRRRRPPLYLDRLHDRRARLSPAPADHGASARAVFAWDIGSVALLLMFGFLLLNEGDDSAMARNAEAQEEGEWTVFVITLAGVLMSFAAITRVLSFAKDLPAGWDGTSTSAWSRVTLFVSWLVTQVVFALRYAHEYYELRPGAATVDGGLEFPGESGPDYWDFLYFSLVLGMTFQVSDVQITVAQAAPPRHASTVCSASCSTP